MNNRAISSFLTITVLILMAIFAQGVWAAPSGIYDYSFVSYRTYENIGELNRLYFSLVDESGNVIEQELELDSIALYDPYGNELVIFDLDFSIDSIFQGRYDAENGQWSYDQDFYIESGYWGKFEGSLVVGDYRLEVVVNGESFEKILNFNGTQELPMIPSHSFQKHYDENDNLHIRWKPPVYEQLGLSTSVRAYVEVYNDEVYANTLLYVRVPSHLSTLYVPNNVMNKLNARGNMFKVFVHIRTNDGQNRAYSDKVRLDQMPEFSDCDVNYDGKTGLEEAINALQVTAGM